MKVKPRKSLSNLTGGLKCMCTHTEAEMVFKRRNEYTTNLQSISTWLLCTFMRSIASIHAHFPRQTDWLMAVATYIYTWQPLWSVAQGLKFKEGGMSSSPQTREKALSLLSEASSRPRNRGDYCDSARIPSAPLQAGCSFTLSTHCLDRHQSFKGISSSGWSCLLPPLNTATESQDSAVVTKIICGWKSVRGKSTGIRWSCASPWKQNWGLFFNVMPEITSGRGEVWEHVMDVRLFW